MEKVQWNSIDKKQNGLKTIEKWQIIHPSNFQMNIHLRNYNISDLKLV